MKIAIYTLTRERLQYTKDCFQALQEKAGYPYDHFIVDNGSQDGTVEWLDENRDKWKGIIKCECNKGISVSRNKALEMIYDTGDYDLIIKMDNDCLVLTDKILQTLVRAYISLGGIWDRVVLSPTVEGIVNQPKTITYQSAGKFNFRVVNNIGGLFCCIPTLVHKTYYYPEMLPKAMGQDSHMCCTLQSNGEVYFFAYIDRIKVQHYKTTDGQTIEYPEYFKRKRQEEKEFYNGI